MKIVQTDGKEFLSEFAPDFARYNDDIFFGEVWNDTTLDLKTRSIITVTALISSGADDNALRYFLKNAKDQGVIQKEIAAVITHIAFISGWPKAWRAFEIAKEIWDSKIETPSFSKDMPYQKQEPQPGFLSDAELLQKLMTQMAKKKETSHISSENTTHDTGDNTDSEEHVCPVCGKHRFANENAKSVCPECGWQNDIQMEKSPDSQIGDSNDCSLNDFRERYNRVKQFNPAYSYRKDGLPI